MYICTRYYKKHDAFDLSAHLNDSPIEEYYCFEYTDPYQKLPDLVYKHIPDVLIKLGLVPIGVDKCPNCKKDGIFKKIINCYHSKDLHFHYHSIVGEYGNLFMVGCDDCKRIWVQDFVLLQSFKEKALLKTLELQFSIYVHDLQKRCNNN